MQSIEISSKVDEGTWNELKALASETHQNVSGLLTEAIRDYVRRKRVRREILTHLHDSIEEHEELGRLLAK
jgi:predicted transcriptional regulator